MKSRKAILLLFLIAIHISWLLAGCTINININTPNSDASNESPADNNTSTSTTLNTYQSRTSIMISRISDSSSISSSDIQVDLKLLSSYLAILRSPAIQNTIYEEYPSVEYTLSLEPIDGTENFSLIVESETPEHLEEICNLAAVLFCNTLPGVMDEVSCKIIDHATAAQLVVSN